MSTEKAMIAQAGPHILAARVNAVIHSEVSKGCRPEISPIPLALEPRYNPFSHPSDLLTADDPSDFIPEATPAADELRRLKLWLSPKEKFNWLSSELFLKLLSTVSHRLAFEIVGNSEKISMGILAHRDDISEVCTAFRAQFQYCELSEMDDEPFTELFSDPNTGFRFLECFPPPPYSHLITRPDELTVTSYKSLIAALMTIDPPAIGCYQALFQAARPENDWHRNVQVLLDLEYTLKLIGGIQAQPRALQQAPSGDLHQMAQDTETKAHNDKPFYFLSVRMGVASQEEICDVNLKTLAAFINLFRNGGRPFLFVTNGDYRQVLSHEKITGMFMLGTAYRPGFLVNSEELAGFVHVPPSNILECREPPISVLNTLPIKNTDLRSGTPIGTCDYAGIEEKICIPAEIRARSTHIIGKPGQAKSTTMAWMVLDDIEKGMGVAVLDPHGDLVEALLYQIKKEHVDRVIYFDPGDREYVPLWNPLKRNTGQSLSRTSDDLVSAIKSVVTGWGDRLEHLLRHGIYALLQLPQSTLLDLSNLLRRKTAESDRLRDAILQVVDNKTAYNFWKNDFDRYSNEALDPPKHKLSKLLLSDRVALMISQPENLIDFRKIMDEGKILLINLSTIGPDEREILGCFILSLLHLTALSRSELAPEERKQFHIHVDEAHRFITEAMEDLIAETRKFGVSLSLAHHFFSQFGNTKIDALSSVGTTIIMNVDTKDARYLTKDLQDQVPYKDLITLTRGEAVVRIGTDIVRIKTPGPLRVPDKHLRKEIIERSRRLYYRPSHVVRELMSKRDARWDQPFAPLAAGSSEIPEELVYDEF
jgi:hypothetical protein